MAIEEYQPWSLAEVMVVEVWLVAWLVAVVEGARLLPVVITGLAVLRLNRLVPAAFCIWKAVAESVWLRKVVAPPLAIVSTSLAVAVVSVMRRRLPVPALWMDRPPLAPVASWSRVSM